MNSSDSLFASLQLHLFGLYENFFTAFILYKVGSLQFRTTLWVHVASYTPRDSSMVLSKFFPSSMVFAHLTKARLPFYLCIPETFLTMRQNSLYVTTCTFARPAV